MGYRYLLASLAAGGLILVLTYAVIFSLSGESELVPPVGKPPSVVLEMVPVDCTGDLDRLRKNVERILGEAKSCAVDLDCEPIGSFPCPFGPCGGYVVNKKWTTRIRQATKEYFDYQNKHGCPICQYSPCPLERRNSAIQCVKGQCVRVYEEAWSPNKTTTVPADGRTNDA